ncbi:MAG: YfhO family protein, partial [Desulfobacterales bacterium]|nr:YfhO family protein [Desulfobacterales bacterium]
MILFGKTLVLRDTFFEFRFLYDFSKENILNGIIPLWNPYSNCGQPFIANPQSAFFYPLNWIFYLLNFQQAYTLFIFIHLFLAGFFMHAFIKPIVKSSWISFFGGLIYMLNGLLISRIEFLSEFASIAWIPAILALLRINVLAPSWLSSVMLALALSIQFFAGHTQSFYYTAFFGLIFIAFLVCVHYIREKKTFAALQSMKFLILAGVLALLIVMIQLAPTYELFTQSVRSQAGYDAKTHLASLHPIHALTFLYPYLFGWPGYKSYWGSTYEFWASSFYVGVIPFVFCLLAVLLVFKVKKTRSGNLPREFYYFIFFLVSFSIAFLIALGDYSPVFRIFYEYVPGFDKFRWPSSSLLFCTISMSVAAPLGLKWLLHFSGGLAQKKSRRMTVTFGALISVFLVFAVVMNLSPNIADKIVEAVRPTPSQSLEDFRSMVENISGTSILSDGNHIPKLGRTVWFSTSFMIIVCVILWRRFRGKMPENYLVACVIFFTAIDLIGHASMGVSFLDNSLNLKEPGLIGTFAESRRNQRVMARTDDYQQYAYGAEDRNTLDLGLEALTGEVGLAQHLFRTEGKGVLKIKNYSEFSGFRGLPFPLQLKILKFLNVKYILHFKSSSIKGSESVELEAHWVDKYQKMAALDSRRWSVQLTTVGETTPSFFIV